MVCYSLLPPNISLLPWQMLRTTWESVEYAVHMVAKYFRGRMPGCTPLRVYLILGVSPFTLFNHYAHLCTFVHTFVQFNIYIPDTVHIYNVYYISHTIRHLSLWVQVFA